MLRLLVLILMLANGVYFAWADGLLRAYGFAPNQQREPQRLQQQINPGALRILTSAEFKRVEAQAQADRVPKECLQAGTFTDAQVGVLLRSLESAFAPGSWQFDRVQVPARWIVYMGKFTSAEGLAKKRTELAAMNLVAQNLNNPELEIGLSLGGFDTQAEAVAEMARLGQRGIRTARVLQDRQEGQESMLRLPKVTPDMKSRLNDLKPALLGRTLNNCVVEPSPPAQSAR